MPIFGIIFGAIVALIAMRRKHMPNPPAGPMTSAEVQAMLVEMSSGVPEANNWANSIVDLLKVLRQDSGFGDRAELWREMGHSTKYDGTGEQNIQLHADVMKAVGERKIVP